LNSNRDIENVNSYLNELSIDNKKDALDPEEAHNIESIFKTGEETLKFEDSLLDTSYISKKRQKIIDHQTLRKYKAYAPTIGLNKLMNARILRR